MNHTKHDHRCRSSSSKSAIFTLSVFVSLSACDDEQIAQLSPRISVCTAADSPASDCNQVFKVGEIPLTFEKKVRLYIFNRGSGPLNVTSFSNSDGVTTGLEFPVAIAVNGNQELEVVLTAASLGPQSATFTLENDDQTRNPLKIELQFIGIAKPVPRIQFCSDATGVLCDSELTVDFGTVRRTQEESTTFYVKNAGTALLSISDVKIRGMASADGEIKLATSTRPGTLDIDMIVPVVVVYEPIDAVMDSVDIVFTSDDPDRTEGLVHVIAKSDGNEPPTAIAQEQNSGSTNFDAFVEDRVILDGSMSSDPEGDPLRFQWVLQSPARSQAQLQDPEAGIVTFTPDVAGSYRAELRTFDSLNQPSPVSAVVLINAQPKFKLRVTASWPQGGDIDVHFVDDSGQLFEASDCYFLNRTPDFGVVNSSTDDPYLRDDATEAPGTEELVFVFPADGIYQLYLHYFDDYGMGAANVNVSVIFDDSSVQAFSNTITLDSGCDLWHVGEISFPTSTFREVGTALAPDCH
jgi:hypothetical protein